MALHKCILNFFFEMKLKRHTELLRLELEGAWITCSQEAGAVTEKRKPLEWPKAEETFCQLKMAAFGIFSVLSFLPAQLFLPRLRELLFSPLPLSAWELKSTKLISSSLKDQ